jgi:hypothetical protein
MTTDISTGIISSVKINIDTLSVQGIGIDTFFYNNTARINAVNLPLNRLTELSEFVFTFNDTTLNITLKDTVSVFYEIHEKYLSFACGILHTFTLDSLRINTTRHYIDSIVVSSTEVNNISNAENIQLYRRPR